MERESFTRALELLDPLLQLRWGNVIKQWVIERKGHIGESEVAFLRKRKARLEMILADDTIPNRERNLATYKGVAEEYESAREGRRVILMAQQLTNKLYDHLCLSDMQRYGGYSRFADELEAHEAEEKKKRERAAETLRMETHREVFDALNHVWRRNETALLNGERDMNVLLHGEKRSRAAIEIVSH